MDRLRQAVEVVASGGDTLDPSDLKALRIIVHFAIDCLDAPRIWRCWENIVIGSPHAADWTPFVQRPWYCKPENGHKGCGWVRVVDDPQGGE